MDYYKISTQDLLEVLKTKEEDYDNPNTSKSKAKILLSEIEDIEQILRDRDEN